MAKRPETVRRVLVIVDDQERTKADHPDIAFLRSHPGYRRLLTALRERYEALGRVGGTVELTDLTDAERDVLSSHLRRDMSDAGRVRLSMAKFAASLADTRWASWDLIELLESYFDEPLVTREEQQRSFAAERERFFRRVQDAYRGEWGGIWLEAVLQETAVGGRRVLAAFGADDETQRALMAKLQRVCRALRALEKQQPGAAGAAPMAVRLPVFAQQVTKDPHAFDVSREGGRWLVDAVATVMELPGCQNHQDRLEVLYRVGLVTDELSNFVICRGLLAGRRGAGPTGVHPIWQAAGDTREVLQVPLRWLLDLPEVWVPGRDRPVVYVVENTGVFSALLDALGDAPAALVCTAGQVRVAGLVLLERLAASGAVIAYSGDFDPEGLSIAQRLAQRFGNSFRLWRFSLADYERCRSQEVLSEKRLAALEGITDQRLVSVRDALRKQRAPGYQEGLLTQLLEDVQNGGEGT